MLCQSFDGKWWGVSERVRGKFDLSSDYAASGKSGCIVASCTRPHAAPCIALAWKNSLTPGCSLEPGVSVVPLKNAPRVVQRRGQGWRRSPGVCPVSCWRAVPASASDVSPLSSTAFSLAAAVVSAPPCLTAGHCSPSAVSSSSASVAASLLSAPTHLECFSKGLCCFAQLRRGSSQTFPFVFVPRFPLSHNGSCSLGFPHSSTASCFFCVCSCFVCLFCCGQCSAYVSSSLSYDPCYCSGICQST